MNLLFSMSLAGSMVFLVYLVMRPLAIRYFSSVWRYRLLKLVLMVYLLPYQYFKYIYYDIFYGIFFQKQYQNPTFGSGYYDLNRLIMVDAEGRHSIKNEKAIFAVLAVWAIVVASFAIYQITKYISCKRELKQIADVSDSGYHAVLDRCRERLRMKKKVDLLCCSYISTPFTIGVFSPRIILPDTLKGRGSVQMAISHELTHVKNHDIMVKFLALSVMVLHWYNPLTYLLFWEICKVYEYACDETVTQTMTKKEKESYQNLIVEQAQDSSEVTTIFANALSKDFKTIKERITLMNKSIISPKRMRIVSFAVAVLLLVMSPLPVLAYSPMVESRWTIQDDNFNFDGEISYSILEDDEFLDLDMFDPFLELGTDYDIFVDDSGVTYAISGTTSQTERVTCVHDWQSGTLRQHVKNDEDGSCIVYIYEGKICSKCNSHIIGSLLNKVQYAVCPH